MWSRTLNNSSHSTLTLCILLLFLLCLFYPIHGLKLNQYNEHFTLSSQSNRYQHYTDYHQQINSEHSHSQSTMQIDYNSKILQISEWLNNAVDINQRVTKVQNQFLGHEEEIRLLGQFDGFEDGLDLERVDCGGLQPNDLQGLLMRTKEIQQFLGVAKINKVNFISDQVEKQQLKANLDNEILYMKSLRQFLESGCSRTVKLEKTYFVSNPNAKNWVLGDWTYEQFVESYVETMNSHPKTTKCPIERPFYSNNKCINCIYPQNVFNMKEQKCTACPYSFIVNIRTRKCVSQIHYVNNIMDTHHPWITEKDDLQTVVEQFNRERRLQNGIVCPLATPFVIDQRCSVCPEGQVYELEQKECNAIPYNLEYDANLHKVVEKLENYQTNKDLSWNVKKNLHQCPVQVPYYDGITCINCQFPTFFNQRTKQCEPCVNLDKCHPKSHRSVFVTNEKAMGRLTGLTSDSVEAYQQNQQQLVEQGEKSGNIAMQCPEATPFYRLQDRQCIQCPQTNPLFNVSSMECTKCNEDSSQFNNETSMCEQKIRLYYRTRDNAENVIITNPEQYEEQKEAEKDLEECPEEMPYSVGEKCIKCEESQVFDVSTRKCGSCAKGYIYNPETFSCQNYVNPNKLTNVMTDNGNMLWIATDEDPEDYFSEQQTSQGTPCPEDKPFSIGQQCITCQFEEGQIFNTSSLECTKCPQKQHYNPEGYNCTHEKPKLYIPGRTDNLIGTEVRSVEEYKEKFEKAVDSGHYDIVECDQDSYSKMIGCVRCGQNVEEEVEAQAEQGQQDATEAEEPSPQQATVYYFNVETYECVSCDNYNEETERCDDELEEEEPEKVVYVANVENADGFVGQEEGDVDGWIQERDQNMTKMQQSDEKYEICPQEMPYVIDGRCQKCGGSENHDDQGQEEGIENGQEGDEMENSIDNSGEEEGEVSNENQAQPQEQELSPEDTNHEGEQGVNIQDGEQQQQQQPTDNNNPSEGFESDNQKADETLAPTTNESTPWLFNVVTNQCQRCEFGYDSGKRVCLEEEVEQQPSKQEYISNLKYGVPNYYTQNRSRIIQEYNEASERGAEVCPFETPFYNGQECIVCPEQEYGYFNLDSKQCENCDQGYKFNEIAQECQQDPPDHYTSLESSNLIYANQPHAYYKYQNDKAIEAGSTECPEDKPYYTIENQCDTCPEERPYFNLLSRRCIQCVEGTEYNVEEHECESEIGDVVMPEVNLEKSLANLFT